MAGRWVALAALLALSSAACVHEVSGRLGASGTPWISTVESSTSTGLDAGLVGSWSQKGIDYAREVAMSIFQSSVKTITLPDLSFDKDSISGTVTNFQCDDLKILSSSSSLEAGTGISLGVDVSLSCHADWSYRENIWPHIPHGSGSVDADTSSSSFAVSVAVLNDNGNPRLSALSCSAKVDISTLDFHGGLTGDILNLFKGLIEKHIDSSMDGSLCDEVKTVINTDFNKVLAGFTLSIPLDLPGAFNISTADFDFVTAPTITSSYVGVELAGVVVNRTNPQKPPFHPALLPNFSPADADHMLQMYLSEYVFNSGAWVFFEAGLEKLVITPSMVPAASPVKLNTTEFYGVAPGLATKYPALALDVALEVTARPFLNATIAGVNAVAPLDVKFLPITASGPQLAFTLHCNMTGALNATVSTTPPQSLVGQITELECPLTLVNSTIGAVSAADLTAITDALFKVVVLPAANKILEPGFPLPTVEGVKLTNTLLRFGDGFVEVATDVAYVGQRTDSS